MTNKFKKWTAILALIFFGTFLQANEVKTIGICKKTDKVLEGITWGNWGSRPYEYYWVNSVVSVEGKRVIDLGVGLPSQYNWYEYIVKNQKPSFYAGIDFDGRMTKEEILNKPNFTMRYMSMADLKYPNDSFDVAYCISTFEHIPYEIFLKSIQECHRVLKDNGLLVITLDEQWDKKLPQTIHNKWNDLELSLIENGMFNREESALSFSLPNFLDLIKDYFILDNDDAVVNAFDQTITSSRNPNHYYYKRENADGSILYSPHIYNSSVSYAVLRKKS